MNGKLVTRDGALHVLVTDTLWTAPEIVRLWYKVESTRASYYGFDRPTEGDEVRYNGSGHWTVISRVSAGGVYTGDGNREAAHVDRCPVSPPKVRRGVELRWERGRWEKLLKRGWVPA